MKLKKILRVIGRLLYWFILGHLISLCILGKNTTIVNIALGFYFGNMLYHIIKYIVNRNTCNRIMKGFKEVFYYLS